MLVDESKGVSREHAEQALVIYDVHRTFGVNTCFTFHSTNDRAGTFSEAAEPVLGEASAAIGSEGDVAPPIHIGRVDGRMSVAAQRGVLAEVDDGGGR